MINVNDYLHLVDLYLNLHLKNLDPDYSPDTVFKLANLDTRMNSEIPFICLEYTIRLIQRYKRAILWTDDFELVNESYRMIFTFMEILIYNEKIEISNIYKLFTNEIRSKTRLNRKYFDINEQTIKLLNAK